MANIFLTGVSATYASPKASDKSLSFAGALNRVLTSVGDEVTWASPSVFMDKEDFNKYDSVLVGISALTSLSSDRAYGALNVINKLWGSEKLVIFVDTPNPSQIEVGLNSYISNPDTLTKSFFSFRKDYSNVVSDQTLKDSVMSGISLLKNEEWGTTIYPKLPWRQQSDIRLPNNAKSNLHGINLDSLLIKNTQASDDLITKWVIDSDKTKWSKSVTATLSLPCTPMKWNKGWDDAMVYENIRKSWGALISPDNKDGTWWNYRYIQALNAGTPIATDWQESGAIGDAWMVLGSNIESMSVERRQIVAMAQKESYLSHIPSEEKAVYQINELLDKKEPTWVK
jgi:hypothetical protein